MYNKIRGAILGSAIGAAMSSPTVVLSPFEIQKRFGYVKGFIKPDEDTFCGGMQRGEVSGDYYQVYFMAKNIVRDKGVITLKTGQNALMDWAAEGRKFSRFADYNAVLKEKRIRTGVDPAPNLLHDSHYFVLSNGAAGRMVIPVGLMSPGDKNKAAKNAVLAAKAVYNDMYSLSGAAAVAAGIAAAMQEGATLKNVIEAGIKGAGIGERIAKREDIRVYPGASVLVRIEMAVNIAIKSGDVFKLADYIGSGSAAAEIIPLAFGVLTVMEGNLMDSIYAAVNIGNESGTLAMIIGAIAGAFHGASALDSSNCALVNKVNDFDLDALSKELLDVSR